MSERTLRIIRIVVVVLNVMVAVVSFRRGDTSAMVIAIAVAALFLLQLAMSAGELAASLVSGRRRPARPAATRRERTPVPTSTYLP